MTSDQDPFAAKLKGYLDAGAVELRPGLAYRLQQARAVALARLQKAESTAGAGQPAGMYTLAGAGGAPIPGSRPERTRLGRAWWWLGFALLVGALVGYQQWMAWNELQELEDLDAMILTSDLPIDAYLDRGFQQWLTDAVRE